MKQFIVSVATAAVKIVVFVLIVKYVIGIAVMAYDFGYRVFADRKSVV